MGYNLLINGVCWGYNPLPNHFLTSWDIQVGHLQPQSKWWVLGDSRTNLECNLWRIGGLPPTPVYTIAVSVIHSSKPNNWLALPVGNEGINLYIGILGMNLPSFPTKGQLDNCHWDKFSIYQLEKLWIHQLENTLEATILRLHQIENP